MKWSLTSCISFISIQESKYISLSYVIHMNYQLLPFKPIQVIEVRDNNKNILQHLLSQKLDVPMVFITNNLELCDQHQILKYNLKQLIPEPTQNIVCQIQQYILILQSPEFVKILQLSDGELKLVHEEQNTYVLGFPIITIGNKFWGYKNDIGLINIQSKEAIFKSTSQILNILKVDNHIWVLRESDLNCIDINGQIMYQHKLGISGEIYNKLFYLIERQDEKYFLLTTQTYLIIYQKKKGTNELIDLSKGYQITYTKDILTRNVVEMYIININDNEDECIIAIAVLTQKGVIQFFRIKISDIDTIVERVQYDQLEQTLRREAVLHIGTNSIVTKSKIIFISCK